MLHKALMLLLSLSLLASVSARAVRRTLVERYYIANCGAPPAWRTSQVGYFENNAGYEEGQNPTLTFDFNAVIFWEGNNVTATMSNGDIFTSHILANAASSPRFSAVGTATSNNNKTWQCFRYWDTGSYPEAWDPDCSTLYECQTSS